MQYRRGDAIALVTIPLVVAALMAQGAILPTICLCLAGAVITEWSQFKTVSLSDALRTGESKGFLVAVFELEADSNMIVLRSELRLAGWVAGHFVLAANAVGCFGW